MSSLAQELLERLTRAALTHSPNAFSREERGRTTPGRLGLNTLFALVEIYALITQIPDADAFMVDKVVRMFADKSLTGATYSRQLLAAAAEASPSHRPIPAVLVAAWVACAYAIQAMRAADAGDWDSAWALACEASRLHGFADGAASELISRFDLKRITGRRRVAPANAARRGYGTKTKQKLTEWSSRAAYVGMTKDQAAVAMEGDMFGLASDTIYKKLQALFPGDSWKTRRIDTMLRGVPQVS